MQMNIGFKYLTLAEWIAVLIVGSFPLAVVLVLLGIQPEGWWLALLAHGILAFLGAFFVAVPNKEGKYSKNSERR